LRCFGLVEIWLPYGQTEIPARVPEERLVDILRPSKTSSPLDADSETSRLIGKSPLLQKVKQAARICVSLGHCANPDLLSVVTDTLLQQMVAAGANINSITVLFLQDSPEFSSKVMAQSQVIRHDPASSPTSPVKGFRSDFEPSINSIFVEADVKVLVGQLRPHQFLGYAGIYDIPFPGLASNSSFLSQLADRKQIEVANILEERMRIARSIPGLFSLGLVLDAERTLIKMAVSEGVDCVNELKSSLQHCTLKEIEKPADIVIVGAGGTPWDNSLVNAVEIIPVGLGAVKRGGTIIFAAECGKGHGGGAFYSWCAERKEPRHLEARLRHNFNYDGYKAAFLLRTLETHRIHLVSTIPDHYVENIFRMKAARTVNSALQTAQRTLGSDSTIAVIPEGNTITARQLKPGPDQSLK
jgi:nickel-dependent lactate racemase